MVTQGRDGRRQILRERAWRQIEPIPSRVLSRREDPPPVGGGRAPDDRETSKVSRKAERLEPKRRVGTRYDKPGRVFHARVHLACVAGILHRNEVIDWLYDRRRAPTNLVPRGLERSSS